MIVFIAILNDLLFMAIPKSFEFPLFIIGQQFLNWLKEALGNVMSIIFAEDDQ
jgi:hypothetical protein